MTFKESISTVLTKYADFTGRASRSEYWWWVLFVLILHVICNIIAAVFSPNLGMTLSGLVGLGLLIPGIAVSVRRLHDLGKTGWLLLIGLIPLIGLIVLYWFTQPGTPGSNEYGDNPLAG